MDTTGREKNDFFGHMEEATRDRNEKLNEEVITLRKIVKNLESENGKLKAKIEKLAEQENKRIREKGEQKKEDVTETQVNEVDSYATFSKIKNKKWPEKLFRSAYFAQGDPLRANRDTDLIVLYDAIMDMDKPNVTDGERKCAFEERYPELKDLDGKISSILVSTKTIKGGETLENKKYITRVEIEDDMQDWYESLWEVRKQMVREDRKKVALYPPNTDRNGEETRKLLECVFRGTNIKCMVYVRKENIDPSKTKRQRKTEAIIIRDEGKTYSELVKMVKGNIDSKSTTAMSIDSMRKARDGGLVMVLNKKDARANNEIKKIIRKCKGVAKVTVSGEKQLGIMYIRGIDGATSKEEVEEVVCRECGVSPENCEVGELRPQFGGNQAVTVKMERDRMEEILMAGRIMIGLSWCSAQERINLEQCYRCLNYGHKREKCTEINDYGRACRKCGEAGHKHAVCSREPVCLICKQPGHMAGAGICPEFKKAIRRAKTLQNKKKRY